MKLNQILHTLKNKKIPISAVVKLTGWLEVVAPAGNVSTMTSYPVQGLSLPVKGCQGYVFLMNSYYYF